MGQYYKPIILSEKETPLLYFYSHDWGSGLKLMEHSWRLNPFVRFVELHLIDQPQRLVWAGDYADEEESGETLYTLANKVGKVTHDEEIPKGKSKWDFNYKKVAPLKAKYLINHSKKEYVNKDLTPKDGDGWKIHPLPLLTCEGNGRGGGDYRKEDSLVGSWARDLIQVSSRKPKDKSYIEIFPQFSE